MAAVGKMHDMYGSLAGLNAASFFWRLMPRKVTAWLDRGFLQTSLGSVEVSGKSGSTILKGIPLPRLGLPRLDLERFRTKYAIIWQGLHPFAVGQPQANIALSTLKRYHLPKSAFMNSAC